MVLMYETLQNVATTGPDLISAIIVQYDDDMSYSTCLILF